MPVRVFIAALVVAACGAVLAVMVGERPDPGGPARAGAASAAGGRSPSARATSASAPAPVPATLAEMIGQRLMVRMDGRRPSPALLRRIRRGHVGGVILFSVNFTGSAELRALTARLHRAARAGGRPPLLIAVDQEGGLVRQVPWAPPAPAAAAVRDAATARRLGRRAGAALRRLGIDMDLAPVADVPGVPGSFMRADGRTFSDDAATVARLAVAFASGLAERGVIAVMKHFPGIGRAVANTDRHRVVLAPDAAALSRELLPYRRAIARGLRVVMLSNAVYTGLDRTRAAGWSRRIGTGLLRRRLGFAGVTMTDSLDGAAAARGLATDALAVRALRAGTDILLVTGGEPASASVHATLMRAARAGAAPGAALRASYRRILALKSALATPSTGS